LWEALKIMPLTAKLLLVFAYLFSGFIYWAGTQAKPNYGCLPLPSSDCTVTTSSIELTKLTGIGLLIFVTIVFLWFWIFVAVFLEKANPISKDMVRTANFWKRLEKE